MKNILKIRKEFLLLLLTIFLASCLKNVEEPIIDEGVEEPDACANITFTKDVKPVIDANCIQCHGSGGNSPNLTSYNSISASANSVKSEVASRRMPRGSSLSQDDIDAVVCWVESGALNN